MPFRREIVRVDDLDVQLLRGGRGAPVLVLHSEFASSRWFPFHDDFARHFQVYAPDHPGFGATPRPDWLAGIDDLAVFYADFLDALGLAPARVVGISFGGWIAAELAALFPERVSHLVLVGAAGLKVDGVERFDLFMHPLEDTLQQLFSTPDRWRQLLPSELDLDGLLRAYREATTLARLSWNPYFYDPKLPRRLRRVRGAAQVVWGEDDRFLPLPHAHAYVQALPAAELAVFPNCGHLPPLECREAFAARTIPFLQQR